MCSILSIPWALHCNPLKINNAISRHLMQSFENSHVIRGGTSSASASAFKAKQSWGESNQMEYLGGGGGRDEEAHTRTYNCINKYLVVSALTRLLKWAMGQSESKCLQTLTEYGLCGFTDSFPPSFLLQMMTMGRRPCPCWSITLKQTWKLLIILRARCRWVLTNIISPTHKHMYVLYTPGWGCLTLAESRSNMVSFCGLSALHTHTHTRSVLRVVSCACAWHFFLECH